MTFFPVKGNASSYFEILSPVVLAVNPTCESQSWGKFTANLDSEWKRSRLNSKKYKQVPENDARVEC